MGLLICGLELLVRGQHVVVLLHHAGGLDMGGGLDGFRTGQIARGGERDSAGQHRTGDYGKWPTADASRPHGDHAARVSAELMLHQVDVMIVGGLGKHGIDKGLGLGGDIDGHCWVPSPVFCWVFCWVFWSDLSDRLDESLDDESEEPEISDLPDSLSVTGSSAFLSE